MAKPAAGAGSRTYVPESGQDAQIIDFVQALEELGIAPPARRPALVAADGRTIEFPEAMFDVLHQVAAALSSGMGVTVAPHNARLTTQEAADFLGMSRPTLVRLLEAGEIPMTKPGRHRFVMLKDLLDYQARLETSRRDRLDQMAAEAEATGLYEVTDGPPPRTR